MYLTRFMTAAAAVALLAGPAAAQMTAHTAKAAKATAAVKGDIVETAKASGQFTTLLKALDATNLTSVLKTNQNLTVFAPTDAAFAALPAGELDRLMRPENANELQKLLSYHVINARVDSSKIRGARGDVKTVEGENLTLDGSGSMLMAGGADIVQSDIMASNGVIHVVDKVLTPGMNMAWSMSSPPMTGAPAATEMTSDVSSTMKASSMSPEQQAMLKAGDPHVTSNPPVADTIENRRKYGQPQSRAGKRTKPQGN